MRWCHHCSSHCNFQVPGRRRVTSANPSRLPWPFNRSGRPRHAPGRPSKGAGAAVHCTGPCRLHRVPGLATARPASTIPQGGVAPARAVPSMQAGTSADRQHFDHQSSSPGPLASIIIHRAAVPPTTKPVAIPTLFRVTEPPSPCSGGPFVDSSHPLVHTYNLRFSHSVVIESPVPTTSCSDRQYPTRPGCSNLARRRRLVVHSLNRSRDGGRLQAVGPAPWPRSRRMPCNPPTSITKAPLTPALDRSEPSASPPPTRSSPPLETAPSAYGAEAPTLRRRLRVPS